MTDSPGPPSPSREVSKQWGWGVYLCGIAGGTHAWREQVEGPPLCVCWNIDCCKTLLSRCCEWICRSNMGVSVAVVVLPTVSCYLSWNRLSILRVCSRMTFCCLFYLDSYWIGVTKVCIARNVLLDVEENRKGCCKMHFFVVCCSVGKFWDLP